MAVDWTDCFLAYMERTVCVDSVDALDGKYDALCWEAEADADIPAMLRRLRRHLDRWGAVVLLADAAQAAEIAWESLGFRPYLIWRVADRGKLRYLEDTEAREGMLVFLLYRPSYNPTRHARTLLESGHLGKCVEVLANVPESWLEGNEAKGLYWCEKLLCTLAWEQQGEPEGRLNRFARAIDQFYRATTWLPGLRAAYQAQALFWERIGRPDMARRSLRSLAYVHPDAMDMPERLIAPHHPVDAPPPWKKERVRRVLMVCHPRGDYGTDVLFAGLTRVLGADNVVDFPWKVCLHGGLPDEHERYPSLFELPGEARNLERVCQELRDGFYDAVLYSDTLLELDQEMLRGLFQAAQDLPVFVLDMWDQCGDYREDILGHIGLEKVDGLFKREMLAGVDYAPGTYPLPFAYDEERMAETMPAKVPGSLFWVGQFQYGDRRMKLLWLEERHGIDPMRRIPQEDYLGEMRRGALGLSLFGNGFDTVRYWELPAQGCMLLSERPPILIPHDFVDGETAVFFDDLPDLHAKLAYYRNHPDDVARIAAAGHAHFQKHHTASARAEQLLGRMEQIISGECS
jgi:hypothetical protein